MIISIDHGNKQIKTEHFTFTSGLCESDTRPPFGKDVMRYGGKYYTVSEERIPYMRDKTVDERFFILTLFGIAFEMRRNGFNEGEVEDVKLCIGLPPAHYGSQYERFQNYFLNRDIIDFELDGKHYAVFISEASCYPQAYAATIPVFQQIVSYPKAIIIDIGGFTADYLMLKNGQADLSTCDSLENGVITLYNGIRSRVNSVFDILLDETDIDAVLQGKQNEYNDEVISLVNEQASAFIADMFAKLRERMIDLRTGKAVFVGGGSVLLRKQIENSDRVNNRCGYMAYYRSGKAGKWRLDAFRLLSHF